MATHPRRRDPRYRYGPWRGGPDPLEPPFDVRRALDALGERVLAGDGVREALRELLRRGVADEDGHRAGLDDLLARAARARREVARRGRLDGAVTRAGALLDQALAAERGELAARHDDDARFAEARLDALPRSTAAAVADLADYDWVSDEARATYQRILDELRRDVLDHQFRGIRDALSRIAGRPEDGDGDGDGDGSGRADQALKDMLADLNRLLGRHARGEDTARDLADFLARHGDLFPERPRDVDELVDALARRAAAGQRLLASLSPQQREELLDLMAQALGDPDLAAEMAALADNLRALRPDLEWGRGERTRGGTPLGYGEAAAALGELADLDEVIEQLSQLHPGATLDDVDVEAVERALGGSAAADVRRLHQLERELEQQGWLTRDASGLHLSPKALRRLGQTALRQVFAHLSAGRPGDHDIHDAGAAGEATGASRTWRFGDEQPLDAVATVGNAVRRRAGIPVARAAGAPGSPVRSGTAPRVRLLAEDFEVVETERRSTAAVAMCVDLSYSMVAEGRWGPMKQTALALAHLVATRFPQDALQIVGFGPHASRLSIEQLAGVEPTDVQGTNLQHALALAGRHLRRHPDAEPVVLVVTDGEPTAHLGRDGRSLFSWPPSTQTVRATIAEVDALTRYGAAINTFLLGDDPGLHRFVDAIARRNGGRVFTPSVERLGEYVVSDYLRSRHGRP